MRENLQAKDLRLGNFLQNKVSKELLKVCRISEDRIETTVVDRSKFPLKDGWGIEPIPLTEEWLLRFGFEQGNYKELKEKHFVKKSKTIKVIISGIGFWDVYTDYNPYQITFSSGLNIITDNRGIKHVNQLQNLYYALTEEELTLKTE